MSDRVADPSPDGDTVLAAIEAVQRAAEAAARALTELRDGLEQSRRQRVMGMPLPLIVDAQLQADRLDARRRASAAIQEYEHAYMLVRAEIIRRLIEDHGYTLSEVAKGLQISRQMASRLLESGRSGTFGRG